MQRINYRILWQDISESLRARRSRSILSLAALSLGMICLSMLASILEGLNKRAEQLTAELGAQVIAVHGKKSGNLSAHHTNMCKKNLPLARIDTVSTYHTISGNLNQRLHIVATGDQLASIKKWPLASGRFLDRADLAQKSRHCVISSTLKERHKLQLGATLLLERIPFQIVGILGKQGGTDTPNEINGQADVYVPRTLTPTWSNNTTSPDIDTLFVQWPQPNINNALQTLKNLLYADPQLRNGNLQFITPDTLLAGIRKIQRSLKLTVGTVAILCLALGGCTLMALMIATVKERISEIGLRFSLGASRQTIYHLFIGEALCITACAAILGTLIGHLILIYLKSRIDLPFQPTWQTLALPSLAALLLAGLFAFWPAWQAAQIRPADALRCD